MASDKKGVRLQKRMAELGVASRRESERYIQAGRVKVNGKKVTELGTRVMPTDAISVDGNEIALQQSKMTIVLHKPPGCLCTRTDPEGRPTIYDLIPSQYPFLAHVGRLDFNTEGLLLMTTDGRLLEGLLDPTNAVPRVYEVKIRGTLSAEQKHRLESMTSLEGEPTRPVVVEKIQTKSKHDWLRLTLFEGKNRHIHRLMKAIGTSVTRLRRVAFGPISLGDLPTGEHWLLDDQVVKSLRRAIENG